ncbi:MAG: hypothetical protein RSA57_03665 [Cetobacterium sp.]|uniref:hypothetical protein n=1 Tax=Bacteria TaxID=2 RepID=UPI002FC6E89C
MLQLSYLLITLCLITIIYIILKGIAYSKLEKNIIDIVGGINEKYEKRILELNENSYFKRGKKSKLDYFDNLIRRSKIRESIPVFTSELLILSTIASAIVFFIVANYITKNPFLKIESGILGALLPIMVLEQIAANEFNKIDDNIIFFINTAINFSSTKNELSYILENTAEYLDGPLKKIVMELFNKLERGISTKVAFDAVGKSIENIRLKELLGNLYNASIGDADYRRVLEKARGLHEKYYDIKSDRKTKIKTSKKSMIILGIVTVVILNALTGISPNVIETLEITLPGQVLMAYFGMIFVLVVYKFFSLSKFNY